MTIKKFILAALFSTLLYASLFLFVMHKPLTIGVMNDYYDKKIGYVETLRSPKLVILAGSNGRFSHRCETIELEHGISCINMSIAATISIDYQLERIKPYLGAGDMVYLPLEYGVLSKTVREMAALDDVPFTAAYDRKYFFNQPLERLLPAIFYFDLKFLISSAGEMALDRLGISRRFSSDTLTKQGDEKGHTLKKAEPYRRYLSQLEWGQPGLRAPVPEDMNVDADSARIVRDFLFYASDADITVVGGLPTLFDDRQVPESLVDSLAEFYRSAGHQFLVLEGFSQYPRSDFYDTPYHLSEPAQIRHSKLVGDQLARMMLAPH